ncbi:MAG TPA: YfhO family protein [Longimicrobiales bacterium]
MARKRGRAVPKPAQKPARTAAGASALAPRVPHLPAWVPAAIYAAVTVLLFREFFFGGTSMLGIDSMALSYFARNFYTEFVQSFHRMPYWNPLIYGGLPFVEGMHGDIFYPPSLALFFLDARAMWGWKMSLHIFLAGVFTYVWLRRGLGLDRLPALFGGLVYMLGTDLVSLVLPGGDGKLFVSALAPLLFWLTERAVCRRRVADFAIFALGLALVLFTSHMQAAYYVVWGVSLYFLFRVWQLWRADRDARRAASLVGGLAFAGVLGVAAAAVQFLPPLEYLREYSHRADRAEAGERGYEWSSTYSLNAEEIVQLVVPEFVGDFTTASPTEQPPGYWGRNPLKLNSEYAGLVPLLLIPVLLLLRRTAQVWFFTGLALLALLYGLASSTPLGRLFYLIPGVSLFRSWSIVIFLFGLSVATLGAIGAQALQDWLVEPRSGDAPARARRVLWIAAGVLGLLALLASAGAVTDIWTAVFRRDIGPLQPVLAANESYIATGFWIAFGLSLAVAGTWHLASRGLLTAGAFLFLLCFWAAADLFRAGRPFVVETALRNQYATGATLFREDQLIGALRQVQQAGGVFRVADIGPLVRSSVYGHNDFAAHGVEQLGGHHGNEMGRFRNLIGGDLPMRLLSSQGLDLRLADVTNTEYLVIPGLVEDPNLEEVLRTESGVLYRSRGALPRAYLVGRTEVVPGEAALERLLSPEFDARTTALLEEPLPADVEVRAGAAGAVEWIEREPDRFTLRVSADRPALLMVLDNWYPAWQATVDGRATPVLRANYTFRAVPVPPGDHTVTFRYEPSDLRTGALISITVLTLLIGTILVQAIRDGRTPRDSQPA